MRSILAAVATLMLLDPISVAYGRDVRGGDRYQGGSARIRVPPGLRLENTDGADGLGMCVWAAIQQAAVIQSDPALGNLMADMKGLGMPGGGWIERVPRVVRQVAQAKGTRMPSVRQTDTRNAALLESFVQAGMPVAISYGGGPDSLYSVAVDHMVTLVHLDADRAAIIDSNMPGPTIWMTRAELLSRWRHRDVGWIVTVGERCLPPEVELDLRPSFEFVIPGVR